MSEIPNVQLIGAKILSVDEKEEVYSIANEYYPKIYRKLKDMTALVVHFKASEKKVKSRLYEIKSRAVSPSAVVESKEESRELPQAVSDSFEKILKEIEHRNK